MSEFSYTLWPVAKVSKYVNSVPLNTPVFIYGKQATKEKSKNQNINDLIVSNGKANDEPNEFYIKRQLGLDEEEQAFEDTTGYLTGIGKNVDDSITNKRINEIKLINQSITEFILENLHKLYWRDIENGVISTMDPNKAVDLIIPAATKFRDALVAGVDKKYNKGLSVANVRNVKETHDLDIKQRLGDNIPRMKKK